MTRNTEEPAALEPDELDEPSDPFWSERSLELLAAEQGVEPINRLEDVLGKGAELWADEEDFEAFAAATEGITLERL